MKIYSKFMPLPPRLEAIGFNFKNMANSSFLKIATWIDEVAS